MRVTVREDESVAAAMSRATGKSVAVFDDYAYVGDERVFLPARVVRWMEIEEDGLRDPGPLSFNLPAGLRAKAPERSR